MEWYHTMRSCSGKRHCQDVYTRLGRSEEPSVTWPVLWAFAVPIAVFIAALLGFELAARTVVPSDSLRMLAGLAVALALTSLVVLAIKRITRRPVDSKE